MSGRFSVRSGCRAARLSVTALASFMGVVLIASMPLRADVTWSNTTSGDWSVASNWGGTLPTAADFAYIANGGTANVTTMNVTCSTLSLGSSIATGSIQMTSGSMDQISYTFVGNSGSGSFTQSGGINDTFLGRGSLYLGYNTGSLGTYTLSGTGSLKSGQETLGYSGFGSFTQSGGTHTCLGTIFLGYKSGSSGSYYLSAGQLFGNDWIGSAYGASGNFTQIGGTNTNPNSFYLAYGGSGSYALSGGQLHVGVDECVGYYYQNTGTFQQTDGTNSTPNSLYLGYNSGSTGLYALVVAACR